MQGRKTAVPSLDKCRMSAFGLRHQSRASLRGCPKTAVWTSTNRCNLNCKFCFGRGEGKELGTQDAKLLIRKMKKLGVKYFVFSGGEPLLRKDILELADYAKKLGMKTILHTNGVLMNARNAGKIAKHFDAVNLPVDGADEKTNLFMGRGGLRHTLEVLDLLAERCEMRVTTVATKVNIDEIEKIAGLLKDKKIKKWRIFQFDQKIGVAKMNRELFEISTREFAGLKRKNKNENAEFIKKKSDFEKSYWMIASDGAISETN